MYVTTKCHLWPSVSVGARGRTLPEAKVFCTNANGRPRGSDKQTSTSRPAIATFPLSTAVLLVLPFPDFWMVFEHIGQAAQYSKCLVRDYVDLSRSAAVSFLR